MNVNMPWVESPFFEEQLAQKKLSAEQEGYARQYKEEGFIHLKGAIRQSLVDEAVNDLSGELSTEFSKQDPRSQNLFEKSPAVKKIATQPEVLDLLEMLYDRKPIPFQTLNFKYGSQQRAHSDTIHFNSLPQRFMCGVWVALEDVDENNGTLVYYPGSHQLPQYDYSLFHEHIKDENKQKHEDYVERYEPFIDKLMESKGLKPQYLTAKKGDVLIWSANLVHGGIKVKEEGRTRWSQVTHYFFEDTLYITPMLSNPVAGEWFLRNIQDIRTGERTWGSYNGQKIRRKSVGHNRYLISKGAGISKHDFFNLGERIYHKLFVKS